MALFTDGTISAIDDIAGHDSAILAVASTEGIDLTKKLKLAQDELELELKTLLATSDSLNNIVVTSAVRLWHAFHTLELVYRDAYSNQLNDRYAGKRDQFAALAKWAFDKLIEGGVGMTGTPVAKAGTAELAYFPGQQAGATYYACTSWVSAQGGEGAAGDWTAITVPDGNVLSVRPSNLPSSAIGWNVFVGLSPETITQQNQSVLPAAEPWLQEDAVSTTGQPPGSGQTADYVRVIARILQRG